MFDFLKPKQVPSISMAALKTKMKEAGVVVIDVRETDEYRSGHIPNAVHLSVGSIDESSVAKLVPSKDTRIYMYCRSGARSWSAVIKLEKLGYTNAMNAGGILDWDGELE